MTKCPYIGINEVAHRVRKLYIGVDGVARKVKRAYVGIDNVARLFYTSEFFLPKGVDKAHCIAAYQFKGVHNLQEALIDRTEHGYNLTTSGTMVWDVDNGLRSGTVTNVNLANLNRAGSLITHVIFYGNYHDPYSSWEVFGNYSITAMGMPGLSLRNRNTFMGHDGGDGFTDGTGQMGMITYGDGGDSQSGHWESGGGILASNTYAPASGVFAGTNGNSQTSGLWLNGTRLATRGWGGAGWQSSPPVDRQRGNSPVVPVDGNVDIYAAAFYDIALTDEQHAELARTMSEIKL